MTRRCVAKAVLVVLGKVDAGGDSVYNVGHLEATGIGISVRKFGDVLADS